MVADDQRFIHITDGGIAQYRRTVRVPGTNGATKERVLDMRDVDASILEPDHGELPVFPMHCRGYRARGDVTVIVIENPPQQRAVTWYTDGPAYAKMHERLRASALHVRYGVTPEALAKRLRTQTEFTIALPFLVKLYVFLHGELASIQCFFRTARLICAADELLLCNLPNCNVETQELCISTARYRSIVRAGLSFAETVEGVELEYWGSAWNVNYLERFLADAARIPEVASPWEWECATQRCGALFATRLPWQSAEWTLGDAIEAIFAQHGAEHGSTFDRLVRRVALADPVTDTAGSGVVGSGIRPSPAQHVALEHVTIAVGDTFVVRPEHFAECPAGGRFRIMWFSTPDGRSRWVQLEGVAAPIRCMLDGALAPGIRHEPVPAEPIVVADVPVTRGTSVWFRDKRHWPNRRTDCVYVVHDALRSADGTVCVRFAKVTEVGYTPLTDGDVLLPGVALAAPEALDAQGFLALPYRLADGTTVQTDDRFFAVGFGGTPGIVTVRGVFPLTTGSTGHQFQTREGGGAYNFEQPDGTLHPMFTRMAGDPIKDITLRDGRVLRVGTIVRLADKTCTHPIRAFSPVMSGQQFAEIDEHGWFRCATAHVLDPVLVIVQQCTLAPNGAELKVGAAVFAAGGVVFDADAGCLATTEQFRGGNGDYDAFVDGGWTAFVRTYALEPRWRPAWLRADIAGCAVRAGMRLKTVAPFGGAPAGQRSTIAWILPPATPDRAVLVVLQDGRAFDATHAACRCFAYREGREWQRFPDDPAAYASAQERIGQPGHGIAVGVAVRYVGGFSDAHQNGVDAMLQQTPAKIAEDCDNSMLRWTCRFAQEIPGLWPHAAHPKDGCRYFSIPAKYLAVLGAQDGFTQVFTRLPRAVKNRCVTHGKAIGHDRNGALIAVGDRVRVVGGGGVLINPATDAARRLVDAGHEFTIVHYSSATLNVFAYLDAGQSVKQRKQTDVANSARIPENLAKDKRWWSRLCFAPLTTCEKVSAAVAA